MNARILLILQFVSLIIILGTAESLFTNRIATIAFATSFVTFARCSIYISKNSKRLLRELEKKDLYSQSAVGPNKHIAP